MRRIEGMDFTVNDILYTLRDEFVDFVEMIDIDDEEQFNSIVDLLSAYEKEYKENYNDLSKLEVKDNQDFSSIKNYYSEYHSGKSLFKFREYMEKLVERRCPICDCSFAYSQATLDHILPKSIFPIFSITPINLVPTCYNCNMRKNDSIPSKVLNPYFHDYFVFDYLTVKVEVNEREPFKSTIVINFTDLTEGNLEQMKYIKENIDLYKLRQKYLDLTNIAFLKLMDEFQQIIHLNSDVYSTNELKRYFKYLDNYVNTEKYPFIDEGYLRHLCIQTIVENDCFLTCLVNKLNSLIDYNDRLDESINNLQNIDQKEFMNHLANRLEFIKEILPLILFIGIYGFKNNSLKLIEFRGAFQKELLIFEFNPERQYLELINEKKIFNVNESLLISKVNPKNKAGTEIVIPLQNDNFCILLIEGSFDINSQQLEKLHSIINDILK